MKNQTLNPNEEWRTIQSFPNYSVSNLGNVKNNKTGRILKASLNQWSYKFVSLRRNNELKTVVVHKLVAEAFLNKPTGNARYDVNHIDMNRSNNNAINLEYITHAENLLKRDYHSERAHQRRYLNNKFTKLINCVSDEELNKIFKEVVSTNHIEIQFA